MQDFQKALNNAHSSKLRIERRSGRDVIVKTIADRERKNEIAFHRFLADSDLPYMTMVEEGDDLVVDFINEAQTLGDAPTPGNYSKLGRLLKTLHVQKYSEPFLINSLGRHEGIGWQKFIEERIATGVERQDVRKGLSRVVVDSILPELASLPVPKGFTVLHGDLHGNNVLLKGDKMYLFDKAEQIFAGDPIYDFALFGIDLPGFYGVGETVDRDVELMQALRQGYGSDFLQARDTFDRYVLLRALERYPNPFESEIPAIVATILKKIQVPQ